SFLEVFKLASHGRQPRGCDDAPPTMESSWLCRRRLDRAVHESRRPTPLPRRRLPRSRDFESTRQRGRLVLRQRVERLPPSAAWRPYNKSSTSSISHTLARLKSGSRALART